MQYRSDDSFIYISGVPYHLKAELKDNLNGVETKKGWRFPKNVYVYRELYKYFPDFKKNAEFMQDATASSNEEKFWLNLKQDTDIIDPRLRPYQNQDATYLTQRGSSLVLNEPRTGKTPTMICTLKALQKRKNLVVCPSSLVYNWVKEFKIWWPECDIIPVVGTPKQRDQIYKIKMSSNFVFIISKDTLKADIDKYSWSFDTMIVDEAHFLRNYKSNQSKAICQVKATFKYALTGTPSVKHGSDVYGLLKFLDPKKFPSYWQFAERYWNVQDGHWAKEIGETKERREDELKSLMAVNSVQRKRKDVMKWLPKAQHQTIPVQMEGKQLKLYDQMFDVFMAQDESTEIDAMNKLSQLMRLRQLCLDPRLLGFEVVGAKSKALLEFAEDNVEPFIVMTTFSSYFKIIKPDLEKMKKKVAIIDGSISKKEKMATAEKFQNGEIDVLLCNIIAAGTGFTLDRSDTIVFLDKDFNPANNEQAQDRIVPTSKERLHSINILAFVAQGSVDERVNQIIDRKEDLTKLINKPEVFMR